MGYLHDIDKELHKRLEALELGREPDNFIRYVKAIILESYKNGLRAGKGEVDNNTPNAPRKKKQNYAR